MELRHWILPTSLTLTLMVLGQLLEDLPAAVHYPPIVDLVFDWKTQFAKYPTMRDDMHS
jgi:hypothetical protein